jgi:hypothetical protein
MLLKYLDFILESGKVETYYYYSKRFKSFLSDISKSKKPGYNVADFILSSEHSNDVKDDITFIDMTDSHDKVSFIQLNRVKRMYDNQKKEIDNSTTFEEWIEKVSTSEDSEPWKKQRTEIFIGRFVNRLSQKANISIESIHIENFVNTYKSRFDSIKIGEENFEEVTGEEIKKWYLRDNYDLVKGELGNSCMRYPICQTYFKIYTENPEVCKLLILKNDEGDKIVGRALVWKLTTGETYMDRIYTIYNSDENLFIEYGERRDWLLEVNLSIQKINKLKVQLKEWEFNEYPYLDTFLILEIGTGLLRADEDLWPGNGMWKLNDVNGEYLPDRVVWSEYHSDYILDDDAVFTISGEWVRRDCSTFLEYRDGWSDPDAVIVTSEYEDQDYLLDDAIRSDIMDDYILDKHSISFQINSEGDMDCIHTNLSNYLIEVESNGEKVKTHIKYTIFNPLDSKYYFKEKSMIEMLSSQESSVSWDKVKELILNSDFNLKDSIYDSMVRKKISSTLSNPRYSNYFSYDDLSKIIKFMLILMPNKSDNIWKDGSRFNRMIIDKSVEFDSLLPKEFIEYLSSGWWINNNLGIWAAELSECFVVEVIKDKEALITWYKTKL